MDIDSDFDCGGWSSMHQPVDWECSGLLSDMFTPLVSAEPVPQQQQQQPQQLTQQQQQMTHQQQQLTQQQQQPQQLTAVNAMAPSAYATLHGTWASSMHQPVDWEMASLLPAPLPSAPLPAPQPMQTANFGPVAVQQQPAPSTAALALEQPSFPVLVPAAAATASQQKDTGGSSNKRDRGARRAKSAALRPQQQQMLELQKKLDALLQEHSVVEAENERLKTRLRVLEAVLPVRQQQARWAQSKAATALHTRPPPPPPTDPVLANLLHLAASNPSSGSTSPSRVEPAATTPACGCCCNGAGCSGVETPGTEPAAGMRQYDNLATGSQPMAAGAEPANSSCGGTTPTATTTTTSGSNPPARGRQGHLRSCSFNTHTHRAAPHHHHHRHRHHSQHSLGYPGPHGGGGGGGDPSSPGDPRGKGQGRWLDAWRAWVREAALLLQAHDARPNDHYLRRLEEAFTSLKSEVVYLGLSHPELVCNMRCANLETGAEGEFPPDSHWSLVVAGMRLDAQQVANCRSALAMYGERMAVVLAERRCLATRMCSCLTKLQLEEAEGRAVPGGSRREQLSLEAEEAAAALDANVEAEGHTTSLARDLLGSNVFSRLQCARASVLSYPYFPDALAILTAAVEEHDAAPTTTAPPTAQPQLQSARSGDVAA